ncbi:unnamed protein product, partial [Urochloa humidicola]
LVLRSSPLTPQPAQIHRCSPLCSLPLPRATPRSLWPRRCSSSPCTPAQSPPVTRLPSRAVRRPRPTAPRMMRAPSRGLVQGWGSAVAGMGCRPMRCGQRPAIGSGRRQIQWHGRMARSPLPPFRSVPRRCCAGRSGSWPRCSVRACFILPPARGRCDPAPAKWGFNAEGRATPATDKEGASYGCGGNR